MSDVNNDETEEQISNENNESGSETDEYQDYTPEQEISEEQMRQTKVILYFVMEDC